MLSLPIPDKSSPIRYEEVQASNGGSVGEIVEQLTKGKIPRHSRCHLDPDIRAEALERTPGWRPLLGQVGSSQTHLAKAGISVGDVFLFFGWFRRVVKNDARWVYERNAPDLHVLWGWLQVGEIHTVRHPPFIGLEWAHYHPHFHGERRGNNTVYVAAERLSLANSLDGELPGAGAFGAILNLLTLTAPGHSRRSTWQLPGWFRPSTSESALSYHSELSRWTERGDSVELSSAGRGQEFVLDCDHYPWATEWLRELVTSSLPTPRSVG